MKKKTAEHPGKVSFEVTKAEYELIGKIVKRATEKYPTHGLDKMTLYMDLTATHANGNPLRLKEFLEADDFNFAHDIFGISNHIDRNTGKMTRCFLPRFSR